MDLVGIPCYLESLVSCQALDSTPLRFRRVTRRRNDPQRPRANGFEAVRENLDKLGAKRNREIDEQALKRLCSLLWPTNKVQTFIRVRPLVLAPFIEKLPNRIHTYTHLALQINSICP